MQGTCIAVPRLEGQQLGLQGQNPRRLQLDGEGPMVPTRPLTTRTFHNRKKYAADQWADKQQHLLSIKKDATIETTSTYRRHNGCTSLPTSHRLSVSKPSLRGPPPSTAHSMNDDRGRQLVTGAAFGEAAARRPEDWRPMAMHSLIQISAPPFPLSSLLAEKKNWVCKRP